jgi:O-methyltransferase
LPAVPRRRLIPRDPLKAVADRLGVVVSRVPTAEHAQTSHPDIADPAFYALCRRCGPFTMTSIERMHALYEAIGHIQRRGIEGDVVECGVWRGGSSMLSALALLQSGGSERTLWLYDTFEGMSEPTEHDVAASGERVSENWDYYREAREHPVLAYAGLADVQANMASTGYPPERVRFVQGKVEDTIPATAPEQIALLRLDTDWYESTRHELEHLYPRLVPGGVLIIDDYGAWQGARRAVDEWHRSLPVAPLLLRVDSTGRVGTKPA